MSNIVKPTMKLLILFGRWLGFIAITTLYCAVEINGCDGYDFGSAAYADNRDDSDVETNNTMHVVNWSGRLVRKEQNFTQLTVHWDTPVDVNRLCAYTLHYYKSSDIHIGASHLTVNIPPNTTDYVIRNLDIGTSYHAYVESLFDVGVAGDGHHVLRSWILVTKTLGFGVDNPCNCIQQTTLSCDKYSGCQCKDTNTYGFHCESCAARFYMDPKLGCIACDQCPDDGITSDGSCLPDDDDGMQCNCINGYKGKHCSKCDFGFYKSEGVCLPCNCSGNHNTDVKDICGVQGHCLACDYHTAGEHCEQCYPGYVGDAFARTCSIPSKPGERIGFALLTLALIVMFIVVIVIMQRCGLFSCRHGRILLARAKTGGSSTVNFTTLTEEPDIEYNDSHRKLQFLST